MENKNSNSKWGRGECLLFGGFHIMLRRRELDNYKRMELVENFPVKHFSAMKYLFVSFCLSICLLFCF